MGAGVAEGRDRVYVVVGHVADDVPGGESPDIVARHDAREGGMDGLGHGPGPGASGVLATPAMRAVMRGPLPRSRS